MLKAMLIDDEIFGLKELQYHLKKIKDIDIIGSFTNPLEGFLNIEALAPDVIFLDIEMPETSGIYLAEQIASKYPKIDIVFITAYNQYAINAFEVNAIDYILKPFSFERIKKCISRLKNSNGNLKASSVSLLSEQMQESVKKFFVYENEDILLLDFSEIFYIEALNKHSRIRTKDKLYNSKHPLMYYENKLNHLNFFRVHRSYIVNLDKIKRICPKVNYSFDIHLNGIREYIPLSRSNVKRLKELLEF